MKLCNLTQWWKAMRKMGIKAFFAHPHHYIVAAGLSGTMLYLGHYSVTEHTSAWLYAVLENISTLGEE